MRERASRHESSEHSHETAAVHESAGAEAGIGNSAITAALDAGRSPFRVGAAADPAEGRADGFAERAAASRGYEIHRSSRPSARRGAIGLEGGELDPASSDLLRSRLGKGDPLDSSLASEFRSLGASQAGSVRIHDDTNADRLAEGMSANAFTIGQDIFFAKGRYQPDTDEGHRMLAHEVGHVGDGADVHREVIRRDVGFEFETAVVVRKEDDQGALVPLAKMEKMAKFGQLSVEADENSSLGSTIEFVIEHVKEGDRKKLEKALDKMVSIAEKLTTDDEPTVSASDWQDFQNTDEYKQKKQERDDKTITGKQFFDYEQTFKNEKIHNDPNRPLLKKKVSGAPSSVHYTPVKRNLLTANPQVTAGIAANKMHDVMSEDTSVTKDPGKEWLFSGNAGKQMKSHAAAVKNLKVGDEDASAELKGLVGQLVSYLKNGSGSDLMNYAKLISGGLMARTDFSAQFRLLPTEEQEVLGDDAGKPFAELVLGAAGMSGEGAELVFQRGVRASQKSSDPAYNERVRVLEGIVRDDWLRNITNGYDALSASQAKSHGQTDLAGELEGLGRLGQKTDKVGSEGKAKKKKGVEQTGSGVVVEFRGMGTDLHVDHWKSKALQAFDYIVSTNAGT
jgi:hypothetical protein